MASALRTWLLITSLVVALAAVWLAVCAPRSLAHLPAHERIAKHAVMVVFSYLIRLIEILCDNFGLNYFSITRSMFNALLPLEKIDPRVKIENRDFDGVRVRIYFPNNRQTHSPAMLFIHGGGWIYFNTEHFDGPCQWFALELHAVVVSVEYHHLPEHRYPATLDDCFRALQFLMRHASNFDIDPTRVAIAGDSAGGHLTAALVMRWRREVIEAQRASNTSKDVAMPPIRMQVLIYPGLQMINSTTVSLVTFSDPLHGRRAFCKAWTWLAFPDNVNDRAVVRALCANNQTTRAARERLAKYFYFGPSDGSEDEVRFDPNN
jgi:acetyl esterase/lipase